MTKEILKERTQQLYLETDEFVKKVTVGGATTENKGTFACLDASLAELQELAGDPDIDLEGRSVHSLLSQTESLIEQVRPQM